MKRTVSVAIAVTVVDTDDKGTEVARRQINDTQGGEPAAAFDAMIAALSDLKAKVATPS